MTELDRRTLELAECQQLWRHGRVHLEYPQCGWSRTGFRVQHHDFVITAVFHVDHPYEPPNVFLSPEPSSRHYYVHGGDSIPRLCWTKSGEWQPRHHLAVAIATAMRFINEYRTGRVD